MSEKKEEGIVITPNEEKLNLKVSQLKDIFSFEEMSLYNIDSSDVTLDHFSKISQKIEELEKERDFSWYVVVHGTDTMEYSSSYISLRTPHINKPIVFTGSMISINEENTDALINLENALKISQQDLLGTLILFWPYWMQANKTTKRYTDQRNAFESIWYDPLYTVSPSELEVNDLRINLLKKKLQANNIVTDMPKLKDMDNNISALKLFPWYNYRDLDKYLDEGKKGLIIEWYWDGNVPQDSLFVQKMKNFINQNVIVILKSQCIQWPLNHNYAGGKKLIDMGVLSSKNLTFSTIINKLMLSLWARTWDKKDDIQYAKNIFERDFAWEYL